MSNKLTATDYYKKDMRERRKNDRKYKKHLKDIAENSNSYPSGAYSVDKETGEETVTYYKRGWRSKLSKYLKRVCNDKIRNNDDETLYNNGEYKKLFDFWWNLS